MISLYVDKGGLETHISTFAANCSAAEEEMESCIVYDQNEILFIAMGQNVDRLLLVLRGFQTDDAEVVIIVIVTVVQ